MLGKNLSAQDKLLVAAMVLAGMMFAVSVLHSGSLVPAPEPAYCDDAGGTTERPAYTVAGGDGEVTIDNVVVLRIRAGAGGFTAEERAMIIRSRLNNLLLEGIDPSDVHAGMMRGEPSVVAGDALIITADPEHGRLNGVPQASLADTWAQNIAAALGGEPGPSTLSLATSGATSAWQPSEPYQDKDVPILSIGRGIQVGMARVTGPKSKVDTVQAVAQLESRLQKFGDVEIYVPVSTKTPGKKLDRVNECAVVGLADLKL